MEKKLVTYIVKSRILSFLIIAIVITSGFLQLVTGNQAHEATLFTNGKTYEANLLSLREQTDEQQDDVSIPCGMDTALEPLSVMRVDSKTLSRWQEEDSIAQEAFIDPALEQEIQATSSYSILDHLNYIPSERSQGWCGNCWAWPATAIVAIALHVQEGIFERLSVQYINSCGEVYTNPPYQIECCEGGNLQMFVNFYRATGKVIPWSNTNANWQDDRAQCRTSCESISTIPSYPITSIAAVTVRTHRLAEDQAINNIKNVLHQDKGVYFTILFPDEDVLDDFRDFWSNDDEDYVYDLDYSCGVPFNEEEAAGHAVLCVGYVDDPDSDTNDYWIMLNSWGTKTQRPNGLFLANMHMNYSCKYDNYYAFSTQTLNIVFKEDIESPFPPEIEGPNTGVPHTTYSYKVSAIDPQGDDVTFTVDWDDGTSDEGLGPVASGEQLDIDHSWSRQGNYTLRVKAIDTHGNESYWTTLSVVMPKNKPAAPSFSQLLERILSRFPLLDKILCM